MKTFIQLPLGLSYRKAFGRANFIVAPCNREAVSWIDKWPAWPFPAVLIYGAPGSGKTHLASIFSDYRIDAAQLKNDFEPFFQKKIVIENLNRLNNEEALFHLFNFVRDSGGGLLMTAEKIPTFHLPDLQSRMMAVPKAAIGLPDEDFILSVFKQAWDDRHIVVDPAVLTYAVRHMDRTFKTIQDVVQTADELSLATGRKITIPVIKETLERIKEA